MAYMLPRWVHSVVFISVLAIIALGCSAVPREPIEDPYYNPQPQETIGKPADAQVLYQQAVNRNVDRWAVVIGISRYKYNTDWNPHKGIQNLRYAHQDAKAFSQFLKSPAGGGFSDDRVVLLTNQAATVKEVRKAIGDFLAQSLEDDLVILFFAGHGSPDPKNPQNLYLLCHDTEPDNFYGTALPMWEIDVALTRSIRSKRVFILADACHSAGVGSTRAIMVANRINTYMDALAQSKKGVTKITASRANELSQEKDFPEGGHGVFTHYLLKGLKGKADDNGDGFVTMDEAYQYLFDRVRSETRHSQTPWSSSYLNNDIPIGIVDPKIQSAIRTRLTPPAKQPVVSKKWEEAYRRTEAQAERKPPREKIRIWVRFLKENRDIQDIPEARSIYDSVKRKIRPPIQRYYDRLLSETRRSFRKKQMPHALEKLDAAEKLLHEANNELNLNIDPRNIDAIQARLIVHASDHRDYGTWSYAERRAKAIELKEPADYKRRINIYENFISSQPRNPFRWNASRRISILNRELKQFKENRFRESMEQAEILLHQGDHDGGLHFLKMAQKYATPEQFRNLKKLARKYDIKM